jgi:hypothetical protein
VPRTGRAGAAAPNLALQRTRPAAAVSGREKKGKKGQKKKKGQWTTFREGRYAAVMPRPLRPIDDGLIYHVINRGNNRQNVFHKTQDFRTAFLCFLLNKQF